MDDAGFRSEAMAAAGTEVKVQLLVVQGGTGGGTLTVTSLSNENPSVAVFTDMAMALPGTPVTFTGTGKPEVDGKTFVLGAEVTGPPAGIEVEGLDGSAWLAPVTTGSADTIRYANACETTGWTGFDGQADDIEITTLCSTAKEFRSGLNDAGNFNMDVNFVQSDLAQQELEAARRDRKPRWFQIEFPNGWLRQFQANVRQFSASAQRGQAITGAVSTRITGDYYDIPPEDAGAFNAQSAQPPTTRVGSGTPRAPARGAPATQHRAQQQPRMEAAA